MKKSFSVSVFLILSIFFIYSCGESTRINQLRDENIKNLKSLSDLINEDFKIISKSAKELADYTAMLYENQENYKPKNTGIYSVESNGVLYKTKDDGKSAVFVSGFVPINDEIKNIVYFTEPIDSVLESIVKNNKSVVQSYFNDKYSYNRIYQFFDVLKQYEPKLNIPGYNFYYLADGKHNPERKSVWVNEPYVDPAGRGWMVSAIAPVYYNNSLEGVVGLDVTIFSIADKYLNQSNKDVFLIDSKGIIVAADEYVTNLLGLPQLKNHKYYETIKMDTYQQEDFNVLKHKDKEFRNAFETLFKNNNLYTSIETYNGKYVLYRISIKELDWSLIKLEKI